MIKKILLLCLCVFGLSAIAVAGWQEVLQVHFDMVETFDNCEDWPVSSGDSTSVVHTGPNFTAFSPGYISGGASWINEYNWWRSGDPTVDWIQDWRNNSGQIWDPKNTGVGKSACVDMGDEVAGNNDGIGVHGGPSHLGAVWAGENRAQGYTEFYVFFMLYIPINYYPTQETSYGAGYLGEYYAGNTYVYQGSTKWATVAAGFWRPNIHADDSNNGGPGLYSMDARSTTYGWVSRVFHISPKTGGQYAPRATIEGNCYLTNAIPEPSFIGDLAGVNCLYADTYGGYVATGEWVGIELHYKMNTDNADDGVFEAWKYDASGNATLLMSLSDVWYYPGTLVSAGDKFNNWFLGGNNSNEWYWGETMDSRYFVDDVIIDGNRIGETYFSVLSAYTPTTDTMGASYGTRIYGGGPTQ